MSELKLLPFKFRLKKPPSTNPFWCLFLHNWGKWGPEYLWEGKIMHRDPIMRGWTGVWFSHNERRQKRLCERCGNQQERIIEV